VHIKKESEDAYRARKEKNARELERSLLRPRFFYMCVLVWRWCIMKTKLEKAEKELRRLIIIGLAAQCGKLKLLKRPNSSRAPKLKRRCARWKE